MGESYVKPVYISLKNHPEYSEKWVQDRIAEDPAILGLGDLDLKDEERYQPHAGRLDLLLRDPETQKRYEVELQLGVVDESHIIRTIEYWDIEKKRYPQYEHCAVLIAEDITSRFLNVISLFNGTVPLIAIQMQALSVGGQTTLVFTKVMDAFSRGLVDEDEDAFATPTDRAYWEKKATKETVSLTKQILEIIHSLDDSLDLKYNKHYIGLQKDSSVQNFLKFRPQKGFLKLSVYLPHTEEVDRILADAGFGENMFGYGGRSYNLWLTKADIKSKADVLLELAKRAHAYYWEG